MEPSKRDEAQILGTRLSKEAIARGEATAWFDQLYAAAGGDAERVPWADEAPNPWLVEWLNNQSISSKGTPACVVGSGLGDDAEELSRRGFDVTAFDISPTAVDWARRRFPESSVEYRVEDLFSLPGPMEGAFDFVFEAYTLQPLPVEIRGVAISCVASLVAAGGELLVVTRGREPEQIPEGPPPWALSRQELAGFEAAGLVLDTLDDFMDGEVRRWRVHYRRPTA
jgi:SAM-dependent methyltransferase